MHLTEEQRQIVRKIRMSHKKDFITLVAVAGLDPGADFQGANLSGVDFGKADLSGFDFSGADLKGAILRQASIRGAIFANADIDGVEWPNQIYGPFHRIASPTQTDETALLQQKSGLIAGRAVPGSSVPSVKAYRGPLPSGRCGVEFLATVEPAPGRGSPFEARWYYGTDGVLEGPGEHFVSIPVTITKITLASE